VNQRRRRAALACLLARFRSKQCSTKSLGSELCKAEQVFAALSCAAGNVSVFSLLMPWSFCLTAQQLTSDTGAAAGGLLVLAR